MVPGKCSFKINRRCIFRTFLSGGVDSSIVSLCLAQQSSTKIETFSIGFDEKIFDETDKSRTVAKLINSNHHEFIISEKI
jgi:asparagine synthase (glutamine-hydrolysing)